MKLNTLQSLLPQWSLHAQRVLVRADLNVPFDDHNHVLNTYKLTQLLPTLECIRKKQGIIILTTHIGRPTHPDPALSTRHLMPWFEDHGYQMTFCTTLEEALRIASYTDWIPDVSPSKLAKPEGLDKRRPDRGDDNKRKNATPIILLENLRFFVGEKEYDEHCAQQLANLGDYFVQDAFGALQNNDTSITLVPHYFDKNHRTIGLLVEHELQSLSSFMHNLGNKSLLIIGGNKLTSKLPFLQAILDRVHTIVFLPALSCNFKSANDNIHTFIQEAKHKNVNLVFPRDYYVSKGTVEAPLQNDPVQELGKDDVAIMCGPETLTQIRVLCKQSSSIIVNGPMGFADRPDTLESMHAILQTVAASGVPSLVGGGDTVAAVEQFGMLADFTHVSTGGGAMLAFMAGESLPGLTSF